MHPSTAGVRIIVTTDVHCHIYCRLSTHQPWIHKKPSLRRGVQFAEDVRFCFTVFEDNEQFEAGDTLTHTFWKTAWPVCTTKWFYFWGSIAGQVCVSTSPIFKYHNTGEAPVPPPDQMYQLNPIDPQFYTLAATSDWRYLDLSRDIPEDATGVLLQLYNTDAGYERPIALRKPDANYEINRPMQRKSTLWVIVGLDYSRRFQYRSIGSHTFDAFVLGYTGRDVVFPDDPIDIKPTANNEYQAKDIGSTWPDARLLLTDLGSVSSVDTYHSIRPLGSTKEIYQGSWRKYPFCGVPANGFIETKLFKSDAPSTQWLAYAYFKLGSSFVLNGVNWGDIAIGAWQTLDVSPLNPASRFAFLEYFHPYSSGNVCCRKNHSYYDYAHDSANHGWMITHVHHSVEIQVYGDFYPDGGQLYGIAETH